MSAFDPIELDWQPDQDQLRSMPADEAFAAAVSLMSLWPDDLVRALRHEQAALVLDAIAALQSAGELELADISAEDRP